MDEKNLREGVDYGGGCDGRAETRREELLYDEVRDPDLLLREAHVLGVEHGRVHHPPAK